LNVGMLGQDADEAGLMEKDVAEKSRIMIALVIIFVKYYFSLITRQTLIFVRKILQREENKGVELTVSIGNGLQVGLISLNETKKKEERTGFENHKGYGTPSLRRRKVADQTLPDG
jgi:hypothetical protein